LYAGTAWLPGVVDLLTPWCKTGISLKWTLRVEAMSGRNEDRVPVLWLSERPRRRADATGMAWLGTMPTHQIVFPPGRATIADERCSSHQVLTRSMHK